MGLKALFILGTRPEVIKLAPVIEEAKKRLEKTIVLSTRQHTDLIAGFMGFDIQPEVELEILDKERTPVDILGMTSRGIQEYITQNRPDVVIVQGDTSTALGGALAAFHTQVPCAHIEAGLRSHNAQDPFPEEMNRKLIGQLAQFHFAPSNLAKQNLLAEGIKDNIHVVGNPVYEAIKMVESNILDQELPIHIKHIILVTCHRRENWGTKLLNIVKALNSLLVARKDIAFIIPQHPNPVVRSAFKTMDGKNRVFLLEPLAYTTMLGWIKRCSLLMTDSGGLVEEAPWFGKYSVILRETTERQEVIGDSAVLVGTSTDQIVKETLVVLDIIDKHGLWQPKLPYYRGNTSKNIIDVLEKECPS